MTTVREEEIASALDEIRQGKKQHAIASKWEIPQATLSGRLHGATSKTKALLSS